MRSVMFFCVCAGVLSLSGCAGAFDPFQRPGDWSQTGAANETIAQQAANKGDLISGQSEATSGDIAATAVEKIRGSGPGNAPAAGTSNSGGG
ncbi:hypothetical protein [Acidocella sp.]|uniref:hypothetical protein n=1 Tax=Acidocella sp. TaxID=50710 RepID=UPI0026023A58|nr:hypothetical protein [Acidocella sp.]